MQLVLPLLTRQETVWHRAYKEAREGVILGRHRRRKMDLGGVDKAQGKLLDAAQDAQAAAAAQVTPVAEFCASPIGSTNPCERCRHRHHNEP